MVGVNVGIFTVYIPDISKHSITMGARGSNDPGLHQWAFDAEDSSCLVVLEFEGL